MIVASHGSENLRLLCDRVMWLDHGEIRAVAPALEIFTRYEKWNDPRAQNGAARGAQSS